MVEFTLPRFFAKDNELSKTIYASYSVVEKRKKIRNLQIRAPGAFLAFMEETWKFSNGSKIST